MRQRRAGVDDGREEAVVVRAGAVGGRVVEVVLGCRLWAECGRAAATRGQDRTGLNNGA